MGLWQVGDTSVAARAAKKSELNFAIGPSVYTFDSAYTLGVDSDSIYREVTDQSIVHVAWMPLQLPNVIWDSPEAPYRSTAHCYAITYFAVTVSGASWTGMPSGGDLTAILHRSGDDTGDFPITLTDSATTPTQMNSTRTLAGLYPTAPKKLTAAPYLLELRSPRNGTGTGRYTRFHRCTIRLAEIATVDGDDYFVTGA